MNLSKTKFGSINGVEVDLYILENDNGMQVKITNYGGIVTSMVVPDKNGKCADIVCGFDTLDGYFSEDYKNNSPYFGCIVGRYAARIKDGQFTLNGQDYQLAKNNDPNHLHGGIVGFDKQIWDAESVEDAEGVGVKLTLTSPDGQEGYPGSLQVVVTYRLNNQNEVSVEYSASTDKATPVSLTNHTYFNLNGFQDKILNHQAMIASDKYLIPDETGVPIGQEQLVAGTVWDYTQSKPIVDAFSDDPYGFEHFYVFSKPEGSIEKVAEFADEISGRVLEVLSSEPGMLFYTGRYTSDDLKREDGTQFGQFKAFCCETSRYPNGPNIDGSPGSVLQPGETYESKTVFKLKW